LRDYVTPQSGVCLRLRIALTHDSLDSRPAAKNDRDVIGAAAVVIDCGGSAGLTTKDVTNAVAVVVGCGGSAGSNAAENGTKANNSAFLSA
jgi:hypothetical protein